MNKKNKKRLIIAASVLLVFIIGAFFLMSNIVSNANKTIINHQNIIQVDDGTYYGEYSISPVYAEVEVIVSNQKITEINILTHTTGLGSSAENITKQVIQNQSLNVDVVSGATVSSKCILKAIDVALGD